MVSSIDAVTGSLRRKAIGDVSTSTNPCRLLSTASGYRLEPNDTKSASYNAAMTVSASDISAEQITAFDNDGVVHIPAAVAPEALEPILELAERQLAAPGQWVSDTNEGATVDRLFSTRYLWQQEPAMHDFVFNSGVAAIAATLMQSSSARFYFDHLLVSEPGTTSPTPWHQDIPYWPFLGNKICSVWVACTAATVEGSSLEFVRGSHKWGSYYAPKMFDGQSSWADEFVGEECPDIEAARDDYDIIGFDVEAGDALVFSSWIVHGAPTNASANRRVAVSTRWLGDDAVWHPHPGSDPTITDENTTATAGLYPADDRVFPVGYTTAETSQL